MADMKARQVLDTVRATVLAGERIAVQILNSDGTTKTTLLDKSVPLGNKIEMSVSCSGDLVPE